MAVRAAALTGSAVAAVRVRLRAVTAWTAGRSLEPTSLACVSVLFALCAAVWFSGGRGSDELWASLAVVGWYLASAAGRRLAAFRESSAGQPTEPGRPAARTLAGSTDWLILPGLAWEDEEDVVDGPVGDAVPAGVAFAIGGARAGGDAAVQAEHGFGWASALCSVAAESALYGGIASSVPSSAGPQVWELAVAAVAATAVASLASAARRPATAGRHGPGGPAHGPAASLAPSADKRAARWRSWADRLVVPSAEVRVLLAVGGLAVAGPKDALAAVAILSFLAICGVIVLAYVCAGVGRFARPAGRRTLLALRDDGPVARWAGLLVQGNLIPLPPVLAGLAATAMLAAIGLHNLPGVIGLAPPIAMLLAAPGSSHPHNGRLDWLVPVLLAVVQYLYLGALGFALALPGPVVFAACALTALWYASILAGQPGQRAAAAQTMGIGWEMRMLLIGLTAIFGVALFGYLGLATYLGVLICRKVVIGYLGAREVVGR